MSVSSILSGIAPQYDSTSNRSDMITMAELQVNRCLFGDKAYTAIALIAAHFIALNYDPLRQNGEPGSMTQK